MMDKATIGQEVEYPGVTRLDNYMMDKVCELNPMLTKSHTPHKDVFFMHKRVGIWSDNQPINERDEWQT